MKMTMETTTETETDQSEKCASTRQLMGSSLSGADVIISQAARVIIEDGNSDNYRERSRQTDRDRETEKGNRSETCDSTRQLMGSALAGADSVSRHAARVAARVGQGHGVDRVGVLRGGCDHGAAGEPGVGDGCGHAGGGGVTG